MRLRKKNLRSKRSKRSKTLKGGDPKRVNARRGHIIQEVIQFVEKDIQIKYKDWLSKSALSPPEIHSTENYNKFMKLQSKSVVKNAIKKWREQNVKKYNSAELMFLNNVVRKETIWNTARDDYENIWYLSDIRISDFLTERLAKLVFESGT